MLSLLQGKHQSGAQERGRNLQPPRRTDDELLNTVILRGVGVNVPVSCGDAGRHSSSSELALMQISSIHLAPIDSPPPNLSML